MNSKGNLNKLNPL